MEIPNELSARFDTVEGRKAIIDRYKDSSSMFVGVNEDGETVFMSVSDTGIILRTEQENGWVRVNFYNADGEAEGETFDGKWTAEDKHDERF